MRLITATVLAIWSMCSVASGHELWLEPAPTENNGAEISIALKVGQDLVGESLPYLGKIVDRLEHTIDGDGTAISARQGDVPLVRAIDLSEQGIHAVTVWTKPAYIVHETLADFGEFLEYEGLSDVLQQHAVRGLPDVEIAEEYLRNARTIIQSGDPAGEFDDVPSGNTFEVEALNSPFGGSVNDFETRWTFFGEPAADLQVSVFFRPANSSEAEPAERSLVQTNQDGIAEIDVTEPGFYVLNAVEMVPADGPGSVVWRSYWASLSFTVEE